MSETIMFVHGAWLTPASWSGWRARFEADGYTTVAPAWPHIPDTPSDLGARGPDPALARLGIAEIVERYATLIEAMEERPILIGHSFGGLIVQLLLDRGLGRAAIAIAPGPPRGVLPGPTALRGNLAGLAGFPGWQRIQTMSEKAFATSFANTMPAAEQKRAYREDIVPAPGRIFYQAAFGKNTKIHFRKSERGPLLILVGSEDKTAPPQIARATYKKQRKNRAVTAYREFKGRSHYICTETDWPEVADHAAEWLRGVSTHSG
jgi:pimeloyl-ACP methyl ester carboxylesterase